jgi:hypothetical protein
MLCCVRSKEHAANVRNYEKLTRERLKILKSCGESYGRKKDIDSWLGVIENKISELGLRVTSDRVRIARELEEFQLEDTEFPRFRSRMTGPVEDGVIQPCSGQLVGLLSKSSESELVEGEMGRRGEAYGDVRERSGTESTYQETDTRPLPKQSVHEDSEGRTQHRTTVYSDVYEDSSNGSDVQETIEMQFGKESDECLPGGFTWISAIERSSGISNVTSIIDADLSGSCGFIVGPEGGFSDAEKELLLSTTTAVTLSNNILRSETAVIACLAVFNARSTATLTQ